MVVFDEQAHEIEIGLASAWKTDLNLFVSHAHQQLEHLEFALWAHWIDQSLVAVAKVHSTPTRSLLDEFARPGAIG